MLPPGGILETPGYVGATRLRGAGSSGIKVAYGQAMRGVEWVVHLSQILVEVIGGGKITLPSGRAIRVSNVRQRDEVVDDLHRHRIHAVGADHIRDAVADERSVGRRISGLGPGRRKVADAFQRGGNTGAAQECARRLAQSRVREEEEGFVVLDRTAESATKLVAMKRRPGQSGSPVIGIEHSVAQVFKERAVKLVTARLGEHVDDATGITTILCVVTVGLDPAFLNRIRVGQNVSSVTQVGHVYAAIQIVVY